jgi:hypothetical protein
MYRTCVLFGWRLRFLLLPACLYLGLAGGILNMRTNGHPVTHANISVSGILHVLACASTRIPDALIPDYMLVPLFTLVLNLVLALMVIGKLVLTRKAMLAMGQHMIAPTAQYITTISIVVESALPWIVSTVLLVVSTFATAESNNVSAFAAIGSSNVSTFAAAGSSNSKWAGITFFIALYDLMGVSSQSMCKPATYEHLTASQFSAPAVSHRAQHAIYPSRH